MKTQHLRVNVFIKYRISCKLRPGMMRMAVRLHIIVACIAVGLVASAPSAFASDSGLGLGFRQMQKIWNGITESPRMTTCRLATRQTVKKKQICVYAGANRTYIAIYNDAGAFCAGEMRCKYDPNRGKTISDFVVAFRNAQKKTRD